MYCKHLVVASGGDDAGMRLVLRAIRLEEGQSGDHLPDRELDGRSGDDVEAGEGCAHHFEGLDGHDFGQALDRVRGEGKPRGLDCRGGDDSHGAQHDGKHTHCGAVDVVENQGQDPLHQQVVHVALLRHRNHALESIGRHDRHNQAGDCNPIDEIVSEVAAVLESHGVQERCQRLLT